MHFPLLADFEPKGAVARQYGVYREKDGEAERALFVIDAEGVNGTPTFFINGTCYDGSPDYDSLLAALESELTVRPV